MTLCLEHFFDYKALISKSMQQICKQYYALPTQCFWGQNNKQKIVASSLARSQPILFPHVRLI
jgi:hypothetical protein